ncbi:unnamed protein product [Adineta ricciae]|uniref:NAD(+)--protein-arginine ADP-ribosyltransferase n=1 Tax=Adineta ricciae TaxID=249248 RepID=A0A815R1F0_ADIRI|nr:unnamed protein product [Adineta ricciae]CAF1469748.1 unnamed protein product [Adineta ricciae]
MGSSSSNLADQKELLYSIADQRCYINYSPKKTVYEWHLLVDESSYALEKAKRLRSQYELLYKPRHRLIEFLRQSNTIIKDSVDAFLKGYLNEFVDETVGDDLRIASENNEPASVLRAYSRSQSFTKKIHSDMAKNTYHQFTLYCTPLNCNILARTHDSIQAFITILFHPKLDCYLCKKDIIVYRGAVVDDERVLEGYEKNSIIISTTFLSTSTDPHVAGMFGGCDTDASISNNILLLCTYKLHNNGRTSLRMESESNFEDEKEILIFPYIPFQIISIKRTQIGPSNRQKVEVEFEEISVDKIDHQK